MSTAPHITWKEVTYNAHWQQLIPSGRFILAGDIGGTNSNFGIMEITDASPHLCVSFHTASQQITDFNDLLRDLSQHILNKYRLLITRACWGTAGVIGKERSYVKPTNLAVAINTIELAYNNKLQECVLINDFEAVGLGIEHINPSAIVTINSGETVLTAQKACIGAGTGLGKAALLWSKHEQRYFPIASEGGHSDCSAQNDQEYAFFTFLKEEHYITCPISWEDVLSGKGISRMYHFLGSTRAYTTTPVHDEIISTGFKPDLISRYAHEDAQCRDTFIMYSAFYARCAKNFALDVLAQNGLYIAGGIAAKNIELFTDPSFKEHFFMCGKQSTLLRNIPLFVIADYNVSLYGAAAFLMLRDKGII